jgi:hypothetical protein
MAKLTEGQSVVFTFNGKNQIGKIENIIIVNKSKRYQVRAESGKLYPHIGINTEIPGKINLPLTHAYFAKQGTDVVTESINDLDDEDEDNL